MTSGGESKKVSASKVVETAKSFLKTEKDLSDSARAVIEALLDVVSNLSDRVEELESRLAKNSSNSSKPPSSDGLQKPAQTSSSRKPSGKKTGGQPGHKGTSLSQVELPDQTIVHSVSTCDDCGLSLTEVNVVGFEKHQVFDLPPLNLIVTEHLAEQKRCPCGCITTAAFPAEAAAPVQYGPWVQTLVVYLSVYQFLPYGRLKEFFSELFGVSLSPATMKRILTVATAKTASTVEAIKSSIIKSALAHFDETGMRVEKTLHWLHSHSTRLLTYFAVSCYRGAKAMKEIGILPKFRGKAIHDAWAPYYGFEDCIHFLCNAHHLRELTFIFEQHFEKWAGRMHALLLEIHRVVYEHKQHNKTGLSAYLIEKFECEYQQIIIAGKKLHSRRGDPEQTGRRGRKKQHKGKNLLDRLDTNRDQVLGFMRDFSIPFTNNQAEGDIRMQKVKQKISGCFRTKHGAVEFAHLRSYISTARKQGHSALEAVHAALINQPPKLT
jgi:transposase